MTDARATSWFRLWLDEHAQILIILAIAGVCFGLVTASPSAAPEDPAGPTERFGVLLDEPVIPQPDLPGSTRATTEVVPPSADILDGRYRYDAPAPDGATVTVATELVVAYTPGTTSMWRYREELDSQEASLTDGRVDLPITVNVATIEYRRHSLAQAYDISPQKLHIEIDVTATVPTSTTAQTRTTTLALEEYAGGFRVDGTGLETRSSGRPDASPSPWPIRIVIGGFALVWIVAIAGLLDITPRGPTERTRHRVSALRWRHGGLLEPVRRPPPGHPIDVGDPHSLVRIAKRRQRAVLIDEDDILYVLAGDRLLRWRPHVDIPRPE